MVFYTLVLQFYWKKWAKEKRRWYLSKEKNWKKKQNSATVRISVDGKWTVFSIKLKLQVESHV